MVTDTLIFVEERVPMKKIALPLLAVSIFLNGCATDGAQDDDCYLGCRYPDSFYRRVEPESAKEIHNRKTANRHRQNVIDERKRNNERNPVSVGVHSSGHMEIKNYIPKKMPVPDHQYSPKEKTWPDIKVKIPSDSDIIIEKTTHKKSEP